MKHGWENKKFERCIEKVTYTEKIQRKDFLEKGKYPIISQEQEFINGFWNEEKAVFKIHRPIIIFGDHTQVIKFVDFDFVLGADGVKILQPSEILYPKYFYYFMVGLDIKNLGYARHYRLLKEFTVPIPPLTEQHRIVAILDEAFADIAKAKENAKKNLKNARELFESYFEGLFINIGEDWDESKLDEICVDLLQGINTTTDKTVFVSEGIPIFQAKEIGIDKIELSKCKYVAETDFNTYAERYKPKKGDILYNNIGSSLGRSILVTWEFPFTIAWNVMRIIPNTEKIIPEFLNYTIKSPLIFSKILNKTNGVGMPFISKKDLGKITIPYPSIKYQTEIIEKLDALSFEVKRIIVINNKKILDLEELKKSLLLKAFNGELNSD